MNTPLYCFWAIIAAVQLLSDRYVSVIILTIVSSLCKGGVASRVLRSQYTFARVKREMKATNQRS